MRLPRRFAPRNDYFLKPFTIIIINWCAGMRRTLNIEDALVERGSELTGIKEKTTLVKLGLEALIAKESAKRLAKLGRTQKQLKVIPRRRIAER